MKPRILRLLAACLLILLIGYFTSYVLFRLRHVERWEKDGNDYVIFSKEIPAVYYFYRRLTYVDGHLTGMRFHLGPHQESN